ncbi:hypothetical protein J6590_020136 [Homalodisca vitripennis]|nr:hypothetical protein J6590_020136 [Homalodisca vitripennis]
MITARNKVKATGTVMAHAVQCNATDKVTKGGTARPLPPPRKAVKPYKGNDLSEQATHNSDRTMLSDTINQSIPGQVLPLWGAAVAFVGANVEVWALTRGQGSVSS